MNLKINYQLNKPLLSLLLKLICKKISLKYCRKGILTGKLRQLIADCTAIPQIGVGKNV